MWHIQMFVSCICSLLNFKYELCIYFTHFSLLSVDFFNIPISFSKLRCIVLIIVVHFGHIYGNAFIKCYE